MKICPQCHQKYSDDTLNYCLNDGVKLDVFGSEPETLIRPANIPTAPQSPFNTTPAINQTTEMQPPSSTVPPKKSKAWLWTLLILGGLIVLCGGGLIAVAVKFTSNVTDQINAIDFNGVARNLNVNFNQPQTGNWNAPEKNRNRPVAGNSDDKQSADGGTVSLADFNKIKTGMTYDAVVEILGQEGEQVSSSDVGNYKTETFKWSGENYSFIIVTVQNDKVIFKSQANLK